MYDSAVVSDDEVVDAVAVDVGGARPRVGHRWVVVWPDGIEKRPVSVVDAAHPLVQQLAERDLAETVPIEVCNRRKAHELPTGLHLPEQCPIEVDHAQRTDARHRRPGVSAATKNERDLHTPISVEVTKRDPIGAAPRRREPVLEEDVGCCCERNDPQQASEHRRG